MGKSSRKRVEELSAELETMRKKFKKMEEEKEVLKEKVKLVEKNDSEDYSSTDGEIDERNEAETPPPKLLDVLDTLEDKPSEENDKNKDNTSKTEKPLEGEFAEIFGPDPKDSGAIKIGFHSCVINRWLHWYQNGIPKEDKEELLKRYDNPPGLEIPKINQEIELKLPQHAKKRDYQMVKRHRLAGAALSSLGWAMSALIEDSGMLDEVFLMERLYDSGKLISELINSLTQSRAKLIIAGIPNLEQGRKQVLEKSKPGEFLFGEKLSEKIKDAQVIGKVAESIRRPSDFKYQKNLNSLGLQGRRPFPNQAGFPMGRQNVYRPRFSFRGRPMNLMTPRNQQPLGPRFPNPRPRKFQGTPN